MRILLVSSSSGSRGGGELFLLSLAESLRGLGHEPGLWASDHPRMDELARRFVPIGPVHRESYLNTYDRRLRSFSDAVDLRSGRRVAAAWRKLAPDVVHLNKQNLEDGLDLIWAARFASLATVCTIHVTQTARYLNARHGWARDAVARALLHRYPGRLVAIGASRRSDLNRFLGWRNGRSATLVENGVTLPSRQRLSRLRQETRLRLGLHDGHLLGLGVGRMVEQKRPLLFLEHAAQVAAVEPRARFCWVGDGPLRPQWDAEVIRHALDERVLTPGWAQDVLPYYAAADFLLHAAAYEGLPLALLEGMAAGLPCVVTSNLYDDLEFLKSAGVLRAGEEGWITTLACSSRRQALGERCRDLAARQYSVERMARDYIYLYELATAAN
ncbi:MAG: glycosyltransferase family 4 protein [Verrucomicrobia bacterium]|nr:glycosyltransferase family 4 protein [Verrucomicrobiota bacterium]